MISFYRQNFYMFMLFSMLQIALLTKRVEKEGTLSKMSFKCSSKSGQCPFPTILAFKGYSGSARAYLSSPRKQARPSKYTHPTKDGYEIVTIKKFSNWKEFIFKCHTLNSFAFGTRKRESSKPGDN